MKKINYLVVVIFFVFTSQNLYASFSNLSHNVINYDNFFMSKDSLYLDSITDPFCTKMSVGTNENYLEVVNSYFEDFDYNTGLDFQFLTPQHDKEVLTIYEEEDACFNVIHNDMFNNAPQAGYPKILLRLPDNLTLEYSMIANYSIDKYKTLYSLTLKLEKNNYEYEYLTTDKYNENNLFNVKGKWCVTSRPYNFKKILPDSDFEKDPGNISFAWNVNTDEKDDILSYDLYLGLEPNKTDLKKVELCPCANSLSYESPRLRHKKKYYWYMVVTNKFGASLETEIFSFLTGGLVENLYNAPNPFNPALGIETEFIFSMHEDGTAQISIYSEYGDLVWESKSLFFYEKSNGIIRYNGKDNFGKTLYNGSYMVILTKKYMNKVETEKCRILIIK